MIKESLAEFDLLHTPVGQTLDEGVKPARVKALLMMWPNDCVDRGLSRGKHGYAAHAGSEPASWQFPESVQISFSL